VLSQVNDTTMRFHAISDKNLAVPALFFFGSKGETNLDTENFFFGSMGSEVICLRSIHGGEVG
jgi:hypothetical protein